MYPRKQWGGRNAGRGARNAGSSNDNPSMEILMEELHFLRKDNHRLTYMTKDFEALQQENRKLKNLTARLKGRIKERNSRNNYYRKVTAEYHQELADLEDDCDMWRDLAEYLWEKRSAHEIPQEEPPAGGEEDSAPTSKSSYDGRDSTLQEAAQLVARPATTRLTTSIAGPTPHGNARASTATAITLPAQMLRAKAGTVVREMVQVQPTHVPDLEANDGHLIPDEDKDKAILSTTLIPPRVHGRDANDGYQIPNYFKDKATSPTPPIPPHVLGRDAKDCFEIPDDDKAKAIMSTSQIPPRVLGRKANNRHLIPDYDKDKAMPFTPPIPPRVHGRKANNRRLIIIDDTDKASTSTHTIPPMLPPVIIVEDENDQHMCSMDTVEHHLFTPNESKNRILEAIHVAIASHTREATQFTERHLSRMAHSMDALAASTRTMATATTNLAVINRGICHQLVTSHESITHCLESFTRLLERREGSLDSMELRLVRCALEPTSPASSSGTTSQAVTLSAGSRRSVDEAGLEDEPNDPVPPKKTK